MSTATETLSETLVVRMSPQARRRLDGIAARTGRTASEEVREMIADRFGAIILAEGGAGRRAVADYMVRAVMD